MGRKLTTEEFVEKAKIVHGDKYDYSLVQYDGKYNKVKIFCRACENYFIQSPIHHYRGHGCSICNKKENSNKVFIKKAKEIHGDRYDYSLVNCLKSKDKIKIICKVHGIFEQNKYLHQNGSNCPKCVIESKKNKKIVYNNTETFIKRSKEIHGDKYDYSLADYKNMQTKIKIICKTHGIFEQLPYNHIKGCDCAKCKPNTAYDLNSFIIKSDNIHGNKYDYSLVDYKNNHTKVKMICKVHGIFEQTPANHFNGNGCFCCYRESCTKSTDDFIKDANIIHFNKYDYSLVDYKNNQSKIKIICPIHGVFEQTPNTHLNKKGCPKCKSSKGEIIVENYLLKNNIEYIKQKTFEDCLSENNNKLKFDFFIYKYNLCIEFDGVQHFESVDYWMGEEGLKIYKVRDKIKNEYCLKNNIRLIRIRYDENIEDVLNKELFNS